MQEINRHAKSASQVIRVSELFVSCCRVFPFALVKHQSVEGDPVHLFQMSVNRR